MDQSLDYRLTAARPGRFIREVPVAIQTGPKIAFGLLVVFLVMLYSSIAVLVPSLIALRPVLVVAFAAIGIMVVELTMSRQHIRAMWPYTYFLAAFLGVAAVSTFSALYARKAFDTTLDLSKIVLIYIVIENTVTSESRLKKVFLTLAFGGMFPAIGTIYHYMNGILIEGSRSSWLGVFKNPNEDAYSLAVLVPITAALAANAKWYFRVLLWGMIGIYIVAIFLTFSRGGLLGLVAALGLICWKQKSFLLRVVMIVGLVGGMAVAAAFWTRGRDFKNVDQDTTFRQRIATVIAGGYMFLDNPLLGVGPGNSMVAYPLYVPKDYLDCGCETQLVIHNAFIQVLSEMGALGFILFMSLLGLTLIESRTMQTGPMAPYAAALEIGLWVFVVCGLTNGFTYTWSPYLLFGLIVAARRIADSRGTDAGQGLNEIG